MSPVDDMSPPIAPPDDERVLDDDLRLVRYWARLIGSGTVEQLRAACSANDRNGDFDGCSFEACAAILVGWMAELLESAQ